jgi:hypothetical protein
VALELLDCKYADLTVRRYAVSWLDVALSDEELGLYLLQLVQEGCPLPHTPLSSIWFSFLVICQSDINNYSALVCNKYKYRMD